MKNLERLFDPRTIVVFGAQETTGTLGRVIVDNLLACKNGMSSLWIPLARTCVG